MSVCLSLSLGSGHLLFEMMCGYELTTLSPSNKDLANVKSEAQVEVGHLMQQIASLCLCLSLSLPRF